MDLNMLNDAFKNTDDFKNLKKKYDAINAEIDAKTAERAKLYREKKALENELPKIEAEMENSRNSFIVDRLSDGLQPSILDILNAGSETSPEVSEPNGKISVSSKKSDEKNNADNLKTELKKRAVENENRK